MIRGDADYHEWHDSLPDTRVPVYTLLELYLRVQLNIGDSREYHPYIPDHQLQIARIYHVQSRCQILQRDVIVVLVHVATALHELIQFAQDTKRLVRLLRGPLRIPVSNVTPFLILMVFVELFNVLGLAQVLQLIGFEIVNFNIRVRKEELSRKHRQLLHYLLIKHRNAVD